MKKIKLSEYMKSREFRVGQMKRGWHTRRETKNKRRPTKDVWEGDRRHFNKKIPKEDWAKMNLKVVE